MNSANVSIIEFNAEVCSSATVCRKHGQDAGKGIKGDAKGKGKDVKGKAQSMNLSSLPSLCLCPFD